MAIGDWDDGRNVANYQQIIEHEEFKENADNQNRLLLGYDRMTAAIAGDGTDTMAFNNVAWTEAPWYTGLYIRAGQAWSCIGAWIYITNNSGTNYLRLEVRNQNDNTVVTIPNASGIAFGSGGWKEITKCFGALSESDGVIWTIATLGRCPSGSFDACHLQIYLNSTLEP